VGVDQLELAVSVRLAQDGGQRRVQPLGRVGPGRQAAVEGGLGDPGRVLVDVAERGHEGGAAHRCRLDSGAPGRVVLVPVPGDVQPAADPDAVVPLHVVEEAGERRGPAGPAHQAAVQAYREHLRAAAPALLNEHVEAVLEVLVELLARVEPCGVAKRMSFASSV
jgi:hypothetical protein